MNINEKFTDETKRFVENIGPQLVYLMKSDVLLAREMVRQGEAIFNSQVKFNKLKLIEFCVKSSKDNYDIPVSAYIPECATPKSPIIVFFHGGGWKIFSRKTHYLAISHLSTHSNCIWLSVEYRLSPEFKHPIPVEDCCSVVKWVHDNKVKVFQSDINANIGVCGDDAGGYLCASVSHRMRNFLAFQILVYPQLDLKFNSNSYNMFTHEMYTLDKEICETSRKSYLVNEDDYSITEASPLHQKKFKDLPKCLIINAEFDPFVDDGLKYKQKLDEANVECERRVIKGTVHGFFHAYLDFKNAFLESTNYILNFIKKF